MTANGRTRSTNRAAIAAAVLLLVSVAGSAYAQNFMRSPIGGGPHLVHRAAGQSRHRQGRWQRRRGAGRHGRPHGAPQPGQESFEEQVKSPQVEKTAVLHFINSEHCTIVRGAHYKQYDHYFIFANEDPDSARLRYREDEFVDDEGQVYQTRTRLTLVGEGERQEFPNAVMLSRSRFLADADRSLRFYREYFAPESEIEVMKDRLRWHIIYKETDFAINFDKVVQPDVPGNFLEIKSRTCSRSDAERKAGLMAEILSLVGVSLETAERQEYAEIAQKAGN